MEKIELRVEKQAGADVGRHWFAVFGVAGGTIGRGGQNKLVLPDADAGVARVHAMVRLESDAAFIANLCERRSMHVAGVEVLSGQEVQLQVGAEVQIGPYSLRAVPPGTPATKVVAPPAAPHTSAVVPAAAVVSEPVRAPGAALASTPNPWADIPHQTWGEGGPAAGLRAPKNASVDKVGSSLGALGASGGLSKPQDTDNPFAMLGRVESGPVPVQGLEAKKTWPQVSELVPDAGAITDPTIAQAAAAHSSAMAPTVTDLLPMPEALSEAPSTPALPNVFDGLGLPARPVAAPPKNRPLLIPADFDPFARDLAKETESRDPWAGGLPAQSLSQVANIQSDELIRSLPLKGQIDQALDNPAHSGLPKTLEPKSETDPMRLFETDSVMDGFAQSSVAAARGAELVQVFNLPKGVEPSLPRVEKVPRATADGVAPTAPSVAAVVSAEPGRVPTVQALGLLPTQELDLGMFGGVDVSAAAPASVAPAASVATMVNEPVNRESIPVLPKVAGPVVAMPTARTPADAPLPAVSVKPVAEPVVSEPAPAVVKHSSVNVDLNLNESAAPAVVAKVANPTPPASSYTPDARALMDAFMAGAGLAPGRVEALMTPEFMYQFGEAFRVAVQGTIELLAARSEIKREFRADVTIIAPRANNPLKFLPNADGVIMQMLGQSFPGFMKPVPSMKEAYFDLQVHQLALMAGIRAAYAEALSRFDPSELEKRCDANGGLLSKISSTARKAAVWDDYKQSYNALRRHAEDDLVAFSGEAFVKAYDAAAEAAREYP